MSIESKRVEILNPGLRETNLGCSKPLLEIFGGNFSPVIFKQISSQIDGNENEQPSRVDLDDRRDG